MKWKDKFIQNINYFIKDAIREHKRHCVKLNNEPLVEMAHLNKNEYGAVPFPSNKFDIRIWSDGHNPPHFHVIAEGWDISFHIESGKVYRINTYGGSSKMYNYIIKNIPIWLQMKSKAFPNTTNLEAAIGIWSSLHDD